MVDASGVTDDGIRLDGIGDLKNYLSSREQELARHLLSQLMVYATGGEIRFSDRRTLDDLVGRSRERGFRIRSMIHLVVASDLFRNK